MLMRPILGFFFCSLQLLGLAFWGPNRGVRVWSYGELTQKADLVVIVTLDSEKLADDQEIESELKNYDTKVERMIARLKIESVFKGKAPENSEKKFVNSEKKPVASDNSLELVHHRLKAGAGGIRNGPGFVSFHFNESYLLFLKAQMDGRYSCVSGFVDPDASVKKLGHP
jgi:hypothetical protein